MAGRHPQTLVALRFQESVFKEDLPAEAARVTLVPFHYRLLQDLIKKDVHGFYHDRWESSIQKHLRLQSETKKPPVWLTQEST